MNSPLQDSHEQQKELKSQKKINKNTSQEALDILSCTSVGEYLLLQENSEHDLKKCLKKSDAEKINQKKLFISRSDLITGTEFLNQFPNVEEIIFSQNGIHESYKYHLFFQALKKLPTIKKIIVGVDKINGLPSLMIYREFTPNPKGWIDSKFENVNEDNVMDFNFSEMETHGKKGDSVNKNIPIADQETLKTLQLQMNQVPISPLVKDFYEKFSTHFPCVKPEKKEEYLRLSPVSGYLEMVIDDVKVDLQIVANKKEVANKKDDVVKYDVVEFYTIGLYLDKSTNTKTPRKEIDIYPDGSYQTSPINIPENERLPNEKTITLSPTEIIQIISETLITK